MVRRRPYFGRSFRIACRHCLGSGIINTRLQTNKLLFFNRNFMSSLPEASHNTEWSAEGRRAGTYRSGGKSTKSSAHSKPQISSKEGVFYASEARNMVVQRQEDEVARVKAL